MLRVMFALILSLFTVATALAQEANDWPKRNILLIIPYPPGSGTDVPGRLIAQKLSEALGQPVVVENRVGASGTLGADAVAKSAADGYTIGLVTGTTQSLAPNLEPKPRYDPVNDFSPIGMIGTLPFVLVTYPGVGAETVAQLSEIAKSKPGSLTFGSAGTASDTYFAALLYAQAVNLNMNHVPYRASSAAIPDLLSGRVHLQFATIAPVLSLIQEGKLRGLAVTSKQRTSVLPNVPTMIEAGVPNYEAVLWMAFVAPANTPAPIIQRLNRELNKALVSLKPQLEEQGIQPGESKPEDVKIRTVQELEKWKNVVAKSGSGK